jgi:hypothetical protein
MPAPWSLPKRIAFRFAFAYLVLYLFPFPINIIDATQKLSDAYDSGWAVGVKWVGKALFGLTLTVLPNGSGDTTFNYIQVFVYAVLAVAATLVWSVLDRGRADYARLDVWLRVYVRFALAAWMMLYGIVKIIPSQFPPPSLAKLTMTFGDQSPMGLLWSFMGASKAYEIFGGLGECLGGFLLTMRRTALLGSLVCIAVLSNVVMLNFCYDVPVKLFSVHLLLMALFLAAPHAKRLADLFVFNRPVAAAELPRLLPEPWTRIAVPVVRSAAVAAFIVVTFVSVWDGYETRFLFAQKPPLYGVWNVESGAPWRSVVFDYSTMNIQAPDARTRLRAVVDAAKKTITLTPLGLGKPHTSVLRYSLPQHEYLALQGMLDGKPIRATLRRVPERDFLLTTRGFHWINEQPLNR